MKKYPTKKPSSPRLTSEEFADVGEVHLSAEEKAAIEAEAKQAISAEKKAQLKKAYMNKMLRQLSGLVDVQHEEDEETYEDYMIDLPGHSDRLIIDGKIYMHGVVYKFNLHQLRTVHDIVSNAWKHEKEIGGAYREYRKPTNIFLSPNNPSGYQQRF